MISKVNLNLSDLISLILNEMKQFNYSDETIKLFRRIFTRLEKLAETKKKIVFDEELAQTFLKDSTYKDTNKFCHSRFCLHNRCVQFLNSYMRTGVVDWSIKYHKPKRPDFNVSEFTELYSFFIYTMEELQLKKNTVDGYERIVFYFLQYFQEKGYKSLEKIQDSDVTSFIEKLCKEHYQPTSLGAALPGLKLFLSQNEMTKSLINSLPNRLQRKRVIIPVLEVNEYEKFIKFLKAGSLSNRDAAICWIALETGLRAVDICNLKINDIDWKSDKIHIVQQKTSKPHELPLRSTYGNAIANYIINERPKSDSQFLFLTTRAPFHPLTSHAGCYHIIYNAFRDAGILNPDRICGTRFTRHNAASYMLRKGVSLSEISATLGHSNPNSVNIYLTTDEQELAECTLPLPSMRGCGYNE